MVFCNLDTKKNNIVSYKFGESENDITGLFNYNLNNNEIEIVKEPSNGMMPLRHIMRAIRMHKSEFDKGIVPELLDYITA